MELSKIKDADLEWLSPILEQWHKIHKNYMVQYEHEDCLYWYNERANVSVFAGAVWRAGGFALEEYSSQKGDEENKKNGRVDLYFSYKEHEAIAEAKVGKLYFGGGTKLYFKERIDRVVSESVADVEKSFPINPYGVGLGLSFITTYWRGGYDASQDMSDLKLYLENSYDDYLRENNMNYKCVFYSIVESDKNIVSALGNYHNAVLLIGALHMNQCVKS